MKRVPNWILGLFILTTLTLLTGATLYLSGIPITPHTKWVAYLGEDSVLQEGAEIISSGIKVGNVRQVEAVPDSQIAPGRYVRATLSVRSDVTLWEGAEIRIADRGLIGGFVVILHRGRPGSKKLAEDTELVGRRLSGVVQEMARLLEENAEPINEIVTNLATVTARVRDGEGTLGRLIADTAVYDNFAETAENVARLTSDLASEDSTLGRLARRPELYDNLVATMKSIRALTAQVESGKGTLGQLFMADGIGEDVRKTTEMLRLMVEDIRRGEGTLGMVLRDPELRDNFFATVRAARQLMDRMGKGGGTLELLLTDKQIFDNLMAVSTNLREVSADIREGRGSLGLLLKDESLYREATRLFESFREAGEIARENAPIASLVSFTTLFFSALN
ncbi:MAG: MlaD family protein [Planctomycetota bacterium]|jgi:phospholipid/cholesterol/gamma-HCH transport system substrate-binding protein